jgi:hypothetical protein
VKIGLVAYRDRGDAYVTKKHGLTGDLDAVFENLNAFRADGGGDTPEHVAKGSPTPSTAWSGRRTR